MLTLSGGLPSWAASATAVSSITGDSGSAAPSSGVIKIYANTVANVTGSSVSFTNSGNISTFTLSDINNNTMLGYLSGNSSMSGGSNVAVGQRSMHSVTAGTTNVALGAQSMTNCSSGNYNVGVGAYSLSSMGTGSQNLALGYNSGANYTGAESNNVLISSLGTAGENNVMRLGTTGTGAGQVSSAYMAGIAGVTVSSAAMVTINTTSGQMGSQSIPTSASIVPVTNVIFSMSPYTVLSSDYMLTVDVTSGAVTVKLPNAPPTGTVYVICDKVGLASTKNITVTTVGGSVTINGMTSILLVANYESIEVVFNGSNYQVPVGFRNYSTAKGFMVDAAGTGDFTTLQAAVTAAAAPGGFLNVVIFMKKGSYTPGTISLPNNLNLAIVAYDFDVNSGSVLINGEITWAGASYITLYGLNISNGSGPALSTFNGSAWQVDVKYCTFSNARRIERTADFHVLRDDRNG